MDQIDSIMYRSRDVKVDFQGCLVTWLILDSSRDTCLTWKLTWSSTCRLWWTKRCSLRLSFGIRIIKIFTSIWWLNDWFIFKKIYFFLFLSSGLPKRFFEIICGYFKSGNFKLEFCKSMSERGGSDIERLWNWIFRWTQNPLHMTTFKFRVVLCRIRLCLNKISKFLKK